MSPREKTVGGGPATGLANDFVSFLQQALQTGSFGGATAGQRSGGANPMGATQGFAGILNDLLSGGAGQMGGSMADMITKNTERQVGALRSRYGAQGGTAFGTGAQHAEGVMRAEQAPALTTAIGGMQMQALMPILQMMMNMSGMGIPQRSTVMQESPWMTGLGTVTGLAGAGADIRKSMG